MAFMSGRHLPRGMPSTARRSSAERTRRSCASHTRVIATHRRGVRARQNCFFPVAPQRRSQEEEREDDVSDECNSLVMAEKVAFSSPLQVFFPESEPIADGQGTSYSSEGVRGEIMERYYRDTATRFTMEGQVFEASLTSTSRLSSDLQQLRWKVEGDTITVDGSTRIRLLRAGTSCAIEELWSVRLRADDSSANLFTKLAYFGECLRFGWLRRGTDAAGFGSNVRAWKSALLFASWETFKEEEFGGGQMVRAEFDVVTEVYLYSILFLLASVAGLFFRIGERLLAHS